jgi:hypothetical protein
MDNEIIGDTEMTIITSCPPMPVKFSKDLLSTPTFGYNAEYLRQIGDFLLRKIHSAGLKKHPTRRILLMVKHKEFMELYERAKTQERENKNKTCLKTQWLGYRPRLAKKNDQRVFDRLSDRAETSKRDRRRNEI